MLISILIQLFLNINSYREGVGEVGRTEKWHKMSHYIVIAPTERFTDLGKLNLPMEIPF